MFGIKYEWIGINAVDSKDYTCGYCGRPLASDKGYLARQKPHPNQYPLITICHFCTRPTFFDRENGKQWPGAAYGNDVANVNDALVDQIYDEARRCTSTSSYTAAVMCCRKLLMHVAVSQGADENKKFAYYVDYLAGNGYTPPGAKAWVAQIKNKGNEANHEIKLMAKEDAEELISFSEMLLKVIYEFPARIKPEAVKEADGADTVPVDA
jgi:hypothetical protein